MTEDRKTLRDDDDTEGHHVAPCPHCDSDVVEIRKQWSNNQPDMSGKRKATLICVYLRHHCAPGADEFDKQYTEIRARDVAGAIRMWNRPWQDAVATDSALLRQPINVKLAD